MAIPPKSYGYPKAAITADKLPIWQQPLSRFNVAGANDWKVSSLASIDRGIRIEAGTGSGDAVTDVTYEYETMSLPSPPIAAAWYLIVRRRNWSGTGTSTLVAIRGTAEKLLPVVGTGPSNRRDIPGTESDQPLALVLVTQKDSTVGQNIDLRCWASNGGVEIADKLALGYLATPGADVKLGSSIWRYELQANGVWDWMEYEQKGYRDGVVDVRPNASGEATFAFPAFPHGVTGMQLTDVTNSVLDVVIPKVIGLSNGTCAIRTYFGSNGSGPRPYPATFNYLATGY